MRQIHGLVGLAGLVGLGLASSALAQEARGDWHGTLEVNAAAKLRLAVHIRQGEGGSLSGTLDSPDQNAFGIALADVGVRDGTLRFAVPAVAGGYEGKWDAAAAAWNGVWKQGSALPLVLTAGPVPAASAPPPADSATWRVPADAEIIRALETRIEGRAGEGIVVGVADASGHRTFTRGPAGEKAFDSNTVFEVGSMSKVFTSLLLADMAIRGEVSIDDPAEKYLPAGATMPSRNGRKITLRDLASHYSGLPRLPDNMTFADPDDPYADYDAKKLLAFLTGYTLTRDIGSQFEYSNLGAGLLGYLLARAANGDYETLLRQRITGPLGMGDTAITLTPALQARFAAGHDQYLRAAKPWQLAALAGAGAIRSTSDDLLKFLDAAMGKQKTPLAPAFARMLADRRPISADPSGPEIGLGWLIFPAPSGEIVFHNGGTGGFRTAMAYQPATGRAAVVLTNAAVEPASDDLVQFALLGKPLLPVTPVPPAPPAPKAYVAVTLPPAEIDRVAGRYQLGPAIVLTIVRSGDGLTAQLTGQPPFAIFAAAPLRFFYRVVDAQIQFTADAAGKVTGLVLTQNGRTIPGSRLAP
ncbi:MAG TPA: serine hydrolase [Sphingomonas sp.]|nr:serine hydrolase [Sphingomonas sp.]